MGFLSRGASSWGARLALVLPLIAASAQGAPTVTASLDRAEVVVGQPVTLTLTFEGVAQMGTPQLPQIPGLIFQGSSQSSRVNIVNNQVSRQLNYSYQFAASQEGQITIPSFEFGSGATRMTSRPLTLKVLPRGSAPSEEDNLKKQAQLNLVVPKKEVYLGESFPVEIHLQWINGRDITTPQLKADGFSLSDNPQNTQRRTPQGYNLVVFRYAATAARAGQLQLGPAECSMTLLVPINGRQGGDPFFDADPFGIFGARARRVPVNLQSEAVEMNVLPLPADGVPASFNGAVGQFTMSVTAAPTNLAVGDPITIRAQISGQGMMDQVNLPEQPQWRNFKAYPPSSSIQSNDPLGLSGTKTFEQVVIAQNHEVSALPPLEFSYFDPQRRSYQSLRGPAFPLQVAHASQTPTPPPMITNITEDASPPTDNILHIKARPDGVLAYQTPLLLKPWFLAAQTLPALAWVSLLVLRKRRESLAGNPRLRRQRQVQQRTRQGLEELRQLASAQQSDEFFATLFRLLQEQIGERLDTPASAITESVVDERLAKLGLREEGLRQLHELFQCCNQARYAPHKSKEELAGLIPNIEFTLGELQRLKV